ncbi:MAG: diaminopimelate decarboxylase [Myxococcales bacterium]|nr:diaminopimelate decarboxylase [Myxococcales bacterium]
MSFTYKNDVLTCEGVPLPTIASAVGTPTYVYSRALIEQAYRGYVDAFAAWPPLICYSVKANGNLGVLSVLVRLGAGADIVSIGELRRWLAAGGVASNVVFSGVGKRGDEIAEALAAGIMAFNVESIEEIELVGAVAATAGSTANIMLRVNPDVDAQTHPYISTGLRQNKFGIAREAVAAAVATAARVGHVNIIGIDCHIGSQLLDTAPFSEAVGRLAELVVALRAQGVPIKYLDIGGGLGVQYRKPGEAVGPTQQAYAAAVMAASGSLRELGVQLVLEPGRSMVAPAGVLLSKVLFRKAGEEKHFTIVDAAFTDLMRPALYSAYHPIDPVVRPPVDRAMRVTDVVGPVCESSDFLAKDRELPALAQGELIAIGVAGAYGASMASNYNARPRPAEVIVDGEQFHIVRRREAIEELYQAEAVLPAQGR